MARQPTISQDDINQICTSIAGSGETPTLSTIRERLGGTGSFSTIQPLLKNWKETSKENADLPPIPEKMEEMALYSVNELWKFGVKLNRKETANLKTLHNKESEDLNKQLTEALAMLDKEIEENEKSTTHNQKLMKENEELKSKYAHLSGRIEEMQKTKN